MRRISVFLRVLYMSLFIALCYVNVGCGDTISLEWCWTEVEDRRNLSVVQLALNVRGGRTLKLLNSLHCVLPSLLHDHTTIDTVKPLR